MEDEIAKRVMELFAEQLGVDISEITRDTSLVNDLNIDSLDVIEVVMQLEEEFHLSAPDDDEIVQMKTVGDVIDYIRRHLDDGGDTGILAKLKGPKKPPGEARG